MPLSRWIAPLLLGSIFAGSPAPSGAQEIRKINEEESQVPPYTLPDPLLLPRGQRVKDAADWNSRGRAEVLNLFETQMFGKMPTAKVKIASQITSKPTPVMDGKATRRIVRLSFGDGPNPPAMDLMVYVPATARGKVPFFVGLNFGGNHAVAPDPRIPLPTGWFRDTPNGAYKKNRATEASRGGERTRWSVDKAVAAGYGVATAYYGDLDPDYDDGYRNGVHPLFDQPSSGPRPPDAWGAIGAWAWGLSRALDYAGTTDDLDPTRAIVHGHSRLGKAALWAGATDPRFAIVISNDSGCGGAALSKRVFGESVARINTSFPHWFCGNYRAYNDREEAMPFDQHQLIGLIAPRPVLVCSAQDDAWADPKGEFLGAAKADPIYKLLGTDGIATQDMPRVNERILSTIGYHMRPGKHDVLPEDWDVWIAFADRHLKSR